MSGATSSRLGAPLTDPRRVRVSRPTGIPGGEPPTGATAVRSGWATQTLWKSSKPPEMPHGNAFVIVIPCRYRLFVADVFFHDMLSRQPFDDIPERRARKS